MHVIASRSIPKKEDDYFDCDTGEVLPQEALRESDQAEFLRELFAPNPSPGAIQVRFWLLWTLPFYVPLR